MDSSESSARAAPTGRLLTIGHGVASQDELRGRLREAGVARLVDVRIGPGSRRSPHLGRAQLEHWLPEYGVAYRWERRLGGFRKLPDDSPDSGLRNASFRAYAAHMRSPEFLAAVDDLLAEAAAARTAVMCSETVWWRCHRRMIADFCELARGFAVAHIMPGSREQPHRPTEAARVRDDGLLVYDVR